MIKAARNPSELKTIYDNVPVMICLLDEDRQVRYANPAFTAFVGCSEDELKGETACGVMGCVNAMDAPQGCGYGADCKNCTLLAAINDTFKTGTCHHNIEKNMTIGSDVDAKTFAFVGSTALIDTLENRCLLLCLTDITERVKMEAKLRKSEEIFQQTFRISPDPINLTRFTDGKYIDINEKFTQIMGYSREETIGKSSLELNIWNNPDDREHLVEKLRKYGAVENMEAEFKSRDGQIIAGLMSARILTIENESIILSVTRDISEIRQNEKDTQTLVETTIGKTGQELFDVAVAKLCEWLNCDCAIIGKITQTDMVTALSMKMDGTYVSDYSYPLKGSPCDESVRKCFCAYPENVSAFFPDDPDLIQMGAQGYVGISLKGKDNEIIGVFCGISRQKLKIKKNTVSIMNIIGARVSAEIIRLETETEKAALEIRIQQSQKMEAIGTLAGGIAHDFNNILFPIIGHSEMLLEGLPENTPFRDSLNEIHVSALRARDLVHQILAFSRQEKNDLRLMKMQPIIKEALKLIRSSIPTTIAISQNLQPGCGTVKADPTQIHQIIMNLTTNAYHAMAETGGELKVSLEQVALDKDDPIAQDIRPGPYARLTVSDTGTGITEDCIPRIFEPFFTTKEKGKGTGMGLSMVHGIVKSMNGAVQVSSEPGKGTEFQIYLPVAGSVFEKQPPQTDHPLPGGSERVLLVDDETAIIAMEKQLLERLGYQVTPRTSGIEALELFRADPKKFDLVITDMAMPKISGDKLAVELARIRPDIPILLCTGFSEGMTTEKIQSLGMKGLLMKPIAIKDFAEKIREILDEKRGE